MTLEKLVEAFGKKRLDYEVIRTYREDLPVGDQSCVVTRLEQLEPVITINDRDKTIEMRC